MNLIIEVILWSTFATVLSTGISIGIVWMLHLPPGRLAHEIEDTQNTAVGAVFFIVSLIVSQYTGIMSGDGYDPVDSVGENLLWIAGGVVLASVFTLIAWFIAHILLKPIPGEGLYGYLRREIVDEQNAALAFFFGGLAVAPFVATMYQII